jgi:hypothetical protein
MLQVLLEQEPNIDVLEKSLAEMVHERTFFGNYRRLLRLMQYTVRYLPDRQYGKVKRKVRRRGYDDKGQLRSLPPGIILGKPEPEIPKIDRRDRVRHPLLSPDMPERSEKPEDLGVSTGHVKEEWQALLSEARRRKELIQDVHNRELKRDASCTKISSIEKIKAPVDEKSGPESCREAIASRCRNSKSDVCHQEKIKAGSKKLLSKDPLERSRHVRRITRQRAIRLASRERSGG